MTKIDLELQTHTLFYKVSFFPQATIQTPLAMVKPALQIHKLPFQAEFRGHYKHWPFIKIAVFDSHLQDFKVKSKIASVGHFGIASQF